MQDRGALTTEQSNPRSAWLDQLSVADAFNIINSEDATVAGAVAQEKKNICRAIELVVTAFRSGGRLIYVGAGTSGRLGVLDATECPPTFLTDPAQVQGIIAGGDEALTRSVEGAEDSERDGAGAIEERHVGGDDVVFGIATGGTTPFVHGALRRARGLGAATVFLACVPQDEVSDEADVSIRVVTGPEVLTGSTRMKAGTATKMVLNMVTTIAMVRTGKVLGNLMVDVNTASNAKLIDRGVRIVQRVTGLSREESSALLRRAEGEVKPALVMHTRGVDQAKAKALLREADDQLGAVISTQETTVHKTKGE